MQSYAVIFEPWDNAKDPLPPRVKSHSQWVEHAHIFSYDQMTWVLLSADAELLDDKVSMKAIVRLSAVMNRNAHYYLFNFATVVFIVVWLFSFSIAIDRSDFGSRGSYSVTLLLTLVAFKLSVVSLVPRISYSTWLDKYLIIAFVFICTGLTENLLVSGVFPDNNIEFLQKADFAFMIAYNVLWIGLHVFIVVGNNFDMFYRSADDVMLHDDELDIHDHEHHMPSTTVYRRGSVFGAHNIVTEVVASVDAHVHEIPSLVLQLPGEEEEGPDADDNITNSDWTAVWDAKYWLPGTVSKSKDDDV